MLRPLFWAPLNPETEPKPYNGRRQSSQHFYKDLHEKRPFLILRIKIGFIGVATVASFKKGAREGNRKTLDPRSRLSNWPSHRVPLNPKRFGV